jgi:membrane peptidoglycan carboxypeptidase
VKNVYLSQEKTITRKIREMIWARALNKTLTKREILTFYVNLVEFGPGLYGVRDAARVYFGKSPAELSPKEAAFLVMLLPSPRRYSVSYRQKHLTPYARRRVSQILLIMHKMGVLDEGAYASARAEALWGVDAGVDAVSFRQGYREGPRRRRGRVGGRQRDPSRDAASGVDRVAAHRCDSPHR